MNHMAEIANMFGLKLGEEFKCSNGYSYKFTRNGLLFASAEPGSEGHYDQILIGMLVGSKTVDEGLEV